MSSGAGVTSGVLAGLAPSSGKRWTINKGLTSARPLPEGPGPQLQSWTRWTGQIHRPGAGLGAWPAPRLSRVTAVVAGRGGAAVLGSGPPPSPPRGGVHRELPPARAEASAQISMSVILKPSTMLSMLRMKVSSFE